MSKLTVKDLASVAGITVEKLLEQFKEAGIKVDDAASEVSPEDKQVFLNFLRSGKSTLGSQSSSPERITLKRKSHSQLKVSSGKTRGSVVNVEVRKKKTYVKRQPVEIIDEPEESLNIEEAALESTAAEPILEETNVSEVEVPDTESVVIDVEQINSEDGSDVVNESDDEDTLTDTDEDITDTPEGSESDEETDSEEDAADVSSNSDDDDEADYKNKKRKSSKKPKSKARKEESDDFNFPVNVDLDAYVEEDIIEEVDTNLEKQDKANAKAKLKGAAAKLTKHAFEMPTKPVIKEIKIPETITVGDLAQKLSIKAGVIIKALFKMGTMATINQALDQETSMLLVEEMGHKAVATSFDPLSAIEEDTPQGDTEARAPVVTIMGHVDHGKTSLLDKIRETQVTAGEAGGITQHIGAYRVKTTEGEMTFLDTPGHAAFTAMRARGSQCTDIVILVVAADDGVMPQTEEAIQHAKAAGVPLIVAINKMDKPEADPDRVKSELAAKEVVPEDWGGDTQFVHVSAHSGEGIDELLNAVLLQAEMGELSAVASGPAKGVIIEARLDKGRGVVATVLVQQGTLKKGNILVAGTEYGKVRALLDENGKNLPKAAPSVPAEVLGLSGVPSAGDDAIVVTSERQAREIIEYRKTKELESKQAKAFDANALFEQLSDQELKKINVLLKADVHGSVEALTDSLEKLSQKDVKVTVIYKGVGGISESDIHLAKASNAIVVGFNVRAEVTAKRLAEDEGINLHYYSIIYDVIDEIKAMVRDQVAPTIKETIVGIAEVKDVFRSSKLSAVAGCMVIEGTVKRNNPIRVLRDNVVIYEGALESLRRFKDDVNEVRMGTECGIGVKDYNDVKSGDLIEVYERIEVKEVD